MQEIETIEKHISEIFQSDFVEGELSCNPIDVELLRELSSKGNICASVLLLTGLKSGFTICQEPYEDPVTGIQEVQEALMESSITTYSPSYEGEDKDIADRILTSIENISTDNLRTFLKVSSLGELIQLSIISTLASRGDTAALITYGDYYLYGKEEYGIYRNRDKARRYYQKALSLGDESARECLLSIGMTDFDEGGMEEFGIRISAQESILKSICDFFTGLEHSPDGTISIERSMSSLVGSPEYHGSLAVRDNDMKDNYLPMDVECSFLDIDPLLYALMDKFGNISFTFERQDKI